MGDPGPAKEGGSLNLTFFNREKDTRMGRKEKERKGKKIPL